MVSYFLKFYILIARHATMKVRRSLLVFIASINSRENITENIIGHPRWLLL
jgi:hypothetical protein